MGIIKDFISRKENEIIAQSNSAVKTLDKDWSSFIKKDTYLIYPEKSTFLELVCQGRKINQIPWYLFWDFKLKEKIRKNIEKLDHYSEKLPLYNPDFVKRKKEEYQDLFKRENLILDEDQQTAVITDDKHNLIVAGAGSGKTEVLITRIAYLIKRKEDCIKPERILALAFQNKAANEIKERLKSRYNVDVEVRTFHSLGNKIIEDLAKIKGIKTPKLKNDCSEDWKFQKYIQMLFNEIESKSDEFKNQIVNFMKLYGENDIIKGEADFKKKEEYYHYLRELRYTSLDGTKVKSEAERELLNFFLMHKLNGKPIKILYEAPAEWMKYQNDKGEEITPKPDFYFPDFDIYLEHWAIGKNGKVPDWFYGKNPTKEYTQSMNIKKEKYLSNNKSLMETSQLDYESGSFHKIIAERFLKILSENNQEDTFELKPLSYRELVESVWESAQFVKELPLNISRFIVIAKTYRLYPKNITARINNEKWSLKQISFGKIANQIYETYQKDLEKGNYIDFSDMINVAADYLKENQDFYKNKYDHILIDEYQDISTQRYEIIKELMNKNNRCKLFCVGDDWQSIMGFAGSNLDFFINFEKYFAHPARTDLTKNYRSIKSIVDAGAHIIKNNKEGQIKKDTFANSEEVRPICVYSSTHDKKFYSKYYEQIAKHCLDTIKEYHTTKNYPYDDFMILLRITTKKRITPLKEYANKLGIRIDFENSKNPYCVRVMSVHKSKGLQARVVMVLNVDKDIYGFPCELENPEIFNLVIKDNEGFRKQKEEERRLFYVAVTRAKEEVILYTQRSAESEFITEIKEFTKREELRF